MANFISDFFENRGWLGMVQQNATTGALEVGGVEVAVTNTDYDTVALMNAATPATGTVALLNPAAFTGTGKPTAPIPMIYTGSRWEFLNRQATLFKCIFGTQATPTMNATTVSKFALAADPIIPGGLLGADGDSLLMTVRFQKHGAAATSVSRVMLGTSATYTNNSIIDTWTNAATDGGGVSLIFEALRTTATTLFTSNYGTLNANHAASIWGDRNTLINFAADQYVSFAVNTITAPDTLDLMSFEIIAKNGVLV